MTKKTLLGSLVVLAVASSCSKKAEEEATAAVTAAKKSISGLPAATAEVVGTSTSSLRSAAASTGVKLSAWAKASEWTSKSRPFCEVTRTLADVISEAMNPDKIRCYVGAVAAHDAKLSNETIDDGNFKYVKLNNLPGEGSVTPAIKFKIDKNASGAITGFEMFSCFQSNGSGGVKQSEYIKTTVTSTGSTIVSKNIGGEDSQTWGGTVSVDGTINSENKWTAKSGTFTRYYKSGTDGFGQSLEVTQKAGSLVFNGFQSGSFSFGGQKSLDSSSIYGEVQLLNASNPKAMALGDGSVKANFSWCLDTDSDGDCTDESNDNKWAPGEQTVSWLGDTRANMSDASGGDYYTDVNAATLKTVGTVSEVTFATAEAWDCTAPEGSTFIEADLTDFETASSNLGGAASSCNEAFGFSRESEETNACQSAAD